jgi:2-polyprenyl-6-methoxyphenol hydroxylase-like FAD-dependent oxidoreductase
LAALDEGLYDTAVKALVVGGGIGGLTSAIALSRAGIEPIVFERRGDTQQIEAGAGMVLWHNAMRALQRIDIASRVEEVGFQLEAAEWQTWRGQPLAHWSVGEMARQLGAPALGIRRAKLLGVLDSALPREMVRLGMECVGFSQDDSGVTARFADGSEERGDVLIGADGINSTVRAQGLGRTKPRYAGYALWFGIVESDKVAPLPPPLPHAFREIAGPGARCFLFPVGGGWHYWSAILNAPEGGKDPDSGAKPMLLEAYKGWPEPVERLLAATEEETIFRRDIVDRKPVKSWGEGRVTILGDAAHPVTPNLGQGAAQAIESAVVVTGCLERGGDVSEALRSYESKRMARTASFTNRAWQIGAMGRWDNPIAMWIRHQIMRVVFPTVAWRKHQKDMAYEW